MAKANHLTSEAARLLAFMSLGGLTAGVGATTSAFTTTAVITGGTGVVSMGGMLTNISAAANIALTALAAADLPASQAAYLQPSGSTGFYVQPANTTVYYVLGVNAAGAWRVVQGTYDNQPLGPAGYTVMGRSVIPDVPLGFVPMFVVKVVSGGSAFTPGTTALTGISTFRAVGVLPVDQTF